MSRLLALLCLSGCASVLTQISDLEDRRDGLGVVPHTKSDDLAVQKRALLALGRIQDPRTASALAEALKAPALQEEAAFAAGLLGLSWQPLDDATKETLAAALLAAAPGPRVDEALGRVVTPATTARLIERLQQGEGSAALALGISSKRGAKLGDDVIAPAEKLLAAGNPLPARYGAAYLLAMLKRPAAVTGLTVALDDADAEVRALAAKGLADSATAAAGPRLERALEDGDVRVAVEAVRALIKLKVELPQKLDGRAPVLLAAAQAGVAVETDDPKLRCRMAMARDKKAGALREAEGCGPLALREVGAVPDARFLTGTSAEQVAALDAIGSAKATGLTEKVRPLLGSDDAIVAAGAAVALAKLGDRASIPGLKRLAARVLQREDIAPAVADALTELDAKEAVPELTGWLASKNATVRHSAAAALTKLTGTPVTAPEVSLERASPIPPGGSGLVMQTERGELEIELWADEHPRTVGNLASLARAGYFDGTTFHRIVPDFVAQGGDPRGDGEGGPGYMIRCEMGHRPYLRGTVGMALSGKDTGGSQFFFTHTATPHLDGRYTAFGRVTRGMAVVDALLEGDKILKVSVKP